MAEFEQAFEKMIVNEGGYKLHHVKGDTGGQTYAGIARNANPRWAGWKYIDSGNIPPSSMVREFYRDNYWIPIKGDEITDQSVAESLFDFGVNAGPKVARKLAQVAVRVTPDGAFGPITMRAINSIDPEKFVLRFSMAKVARYRDIVNKNRSQIKFLLGWLNRTLKGVA